MKKLILLIVIVAIGYVWWTGSGGLIPNSIEALDAKYLQGDVLPRENNLHVYESGLQRFAANNPGLKEQTDLRFAGIDLVKSLDTASEKSRLIDIESASCQAQVQELQKAISVVVTKSSTVISKASAILRSGSDDFVENMKFTATGIKTRYETEQQNLQTLC